MKILAPAPEIEAPSTSEVTRLCGNGYNWKLFLVTRFTGLKCSYITVIWDSSNNTYQPNLVSRTCIEFSVGCGKGFCGGGEAAPAMIQN